MKEDNPLLEAYVREKDDEMRRKFSDWARVCKAHYDAFISEGFTPRQSMELLKFWWEQVDKKQKDNDK